jgi:hypothetical protein
MLGSNFSVELCDLRSEWGPNCFGVWCGFIFRIELTPDQCIRHMNQKHLGHRHRYEIHTEPQGPTLAAVLTADAVQKVIRLREFR